MRPDGTVRFEPVAQLVEQRTFNPRVLGSSPSGLTAKNRIRSTKLDARSAVSGHYFGRSSDLTAKLTAKLFD